jgi:hypothetical protein
MDVTRRSLARTLATTLATAAAAQQVGVSQPAAPADADAQSARDVMKSNAQQIAKIKLPIATEPAFHFKA